MLKPQELVDLLKIYNIQEPLTKYQICKLLFGSYRSSSAYEKIDHYIELGVLYFYDKKTLTPNKEEIAKVLRVSGFYKMIMEVIDDGYIWVIK